MLSAPDRLPGCTITRPAPRRAPPSGRVATADPPTIVTGRSQRPHPIRVMPSRVLRQLPQPALERVEAVLRCLELVEEPERSLPVEAVPAAGRRRDEQAAD